NTETRLWTFRLKRSGGSGEAAELGTKPRPLKSAMLCRRLGNAPVGCAWVPSVAPSAKMVRGASPGVVFTKAPRGKLNPVSAIGARLTWSTTALVAVETTSTTASRESSKIPSPTTGAPLAPAGKGALSVPPRLAVLGGTNPARGRAKKFGTYSTSSRSSESPSLVMASARGLRPTGIVALTVLVLVSITCTVLSLALATETNRPLGEETMAWGSVPTVMVATVA